MPSKKTSRIQLVIDLAKKAQTQAARNLSQAQDTAASEQARLNELRQYYQSYAEQAQKKSVAISAEDIQQSRHFLARLSTAVDIQKQQLASAHLRVDTTIKQWRLAHHKVEKLESYQQDLLTKEAMIDSKLEQKLIDELSIHSQRHRY